jgi:predicted acylesterase/phospholipase RssA
MGDISSAVKNGKKKIEPPSCTKLELKPEIEPNSVGEEVKGQIHHPAEVQTLGNPLSKNTGYDVLCLQGTSTKALYCLGCLQCLADNGCLDSLKHYVGTSSGSLVCYFTLLGYSAAESLSNLCTDDVFASVSKNFNLIKMLNGGGATSWSRIQETIEKLTIEKIGVLPTMLSLHKLTGKTFTVVTFNLTKHKTIYINHKTHPDLPVTVALRMSCNLPFVFEKYLYDGSYYIDGGVADNFALTHAQSLGNRVCGIRVHNLPDTTPKDSFMTYLYQIISLPIIELERIRMGQMKSSTTVITLQTDKLVAPYDFDMNNSQKMDMFSTGYSQVAKAFTT